MDTGSLLAFTAFKHPWRSFSLLQGFTASTTGSMSNDGRREMRRLISLAVDQGWVYLGRNGRHHKLQNPLGERIPLPCTPLSDRHTLENIRARLRRHGLIIEHRSKKKA